MQLEEEAQKPPKILAGRKTAAPGDAFAFLEKLPPHLMVFLLAEASNAKAVNKVRNYLHKWRPLRQALPAAEMELEAFGLARGPKFDKVVEDFFQSAAAGKGRDAGRSHASYCASLPASRKPKKKEEKKKPTKN